MNPGNVTPPVTIDSIDLDKEVHWVCIKDEAADYVWTCYFVGGEREGILNPGDTAELFTEVKIPGEWGVEANAYGRWKLPYLQRQSRLTGSGLYMNETEMP